MGAGADSCPCERWRSGSIKQTPPEVTVSVRMSRTCLAEWACLLSFRPGIGKSVVWFFFCVSCFHLFSLLDERFSHQKGHTLQVIPVLFIRPRKRLLWLGNAPYWYGGCIISVEGFNESIKRPRHEKNGSARRPLRGSGKDNGK